MIDRPLRRRHPARRTYRRGLERIEQAVEAVAIEVERIAESQRFSTKLMAEQREGACRVRRRTAAPMPSVLIVDDEPNIRRMVGALLGAEGYEVRDAQDGASGVARAIETEPDVLLLDLMMPGELDGMATLARCASRCPMCPW